jgi:SAM-dependent methyltransferase
MENFASPGAIAPVSELAHSEEYFGPYRDFWWNTDFLALMAARWQLGACRRVLDMGCGQCHWSRLLLPYLAKSAHVTAFDKDAKWAAGSEGLVRDFAARSTVLEFQQGDAHQLPFANDSFDLVTCQTVLIHLANPAAALTEMKRVVRPGGLVVCVEPCNLASVATPTMFTPTTSVDELCDEFRYALLCERAKTAAGEGDSSLGSSLAHLFQLTGFSHIKSYLSDKAHAVLPPYGDAESAASVAELLAAARADRSDLADRQVDAWIAALQDPDAVAFVERYRARKADHPNDLPAMIKEGSYWDSGAALMYLVSGRK